jgi:A-factor type gamma-butyrolactone 1'-reductase (1S-forming)
MERFRDKVALVTGATSGIGKAAAIEWAREGARVVVSGRRTEKGDAVAREIRSEGGEAVYVPADVTDAASLVALVAATVARYGGLDYAFNNAGIGGDNFKPAAEHTLENWTAVMATNLTGVWLAMKYEIPEMLKRGKGAIVNTASFYGLSGSDFGIAPYVASKHGVVGLTKTAGIEYARKGIRINAVCPGFTMTELIEPALEHAPDQLMADIDRRVPLGRIAEAREIARAVLWLASDDAAYMTGQTLSIDGGVISGC